MFDNTMGLALYVSGSDIAEHKNADKFITIENTLMIGQSPWTDCDTVKVEMFSEDMNNVGESNKHMVFTHNCIANQIKIII